MKKPSNERRRPARDPSPWLLPEYKSLPVDGKFSDDFAVKNSHLYYHYARDGIIIDKACK